MRRFNLDRRTRARNRRDEIRLNNDTPGSRLELSWENFGRFATRSVLNIDPESIHENSGPHGRTKVTYLHTAAESSNEQLLDYLLSQGAPVNKELSPQGTALHVAASQPNVRIIQKLILHGADVNYHRLDDNWTPLCCAVHAQLLKNVELIVGMMGKVNPNLKGMTLGPLHIAVDNNDDEMIELLMTGFADIDAPTNENSTPLCHAVTNRNLKMVECLLQHYADVNAFSNIEESIHFRMTPLHMAVLINDLKIVKTLLNNDADVNARTPRNQSPLHLAIVHHSFHVIDELLHSGADLNIIDNDNQSLLDVCRKDIVDKYMLEGLIQHAIKLHAANINLRKNILTHIRGSPNWDLYYDKYCEELERMKITSIGTTCYMYYHLVIKSIHVLSIYAKNSSFISAASPEILKDQFPEYADIMINRVKKAEIRRNLMATVEEFLWETLNDLPDTIVNEVFHYLSNEDLRLLKKDLSNHVSIPLGFWGFTKENRVTQKKRYICH